MNELLKAIIQQPHDDQLRLIYADWLEEHGDPRADFIRVQLSLKNTENGSPGYRQLKHREHQLLREHGTQWSCGVIAGVPTAEQFDRGFLSHLEIRAKALAGRIVMLREQPVVSLRLTGSHLPSVPELFNKRWFQRLRVLDCSGFRANPKTVQSIAQSANFSNLEELRLGSGDPGKTGLRALRQGKLKSLKRLAIQIKTQHEDDWYALTHSDAFQRLERLEVSVSASRDDEHEAASVVLEGLAAASPLPKLRELRFAYLPRAIECFARFFHQLRLPSLETLDFGSTPLRDAEIEAIANCDGLPSLRRLNVGAAVVGNAGARVLAQSPLCEQLEWLLLPFDTGRMRSEATQRALRRQFQEFEALRQGDLFTGVAAATQSSTL